MRLLFRNLLCNAMIMQSVLIWVTSSFMGGYPATVSLALSCLSAFYPHVDVFSLNLPISILHCLYPLLQTLGW